MDSPPTHQERRLRRQFAAATRAMPALSRPMQVLLRRDRWPLRLPAGILLVGGGMLSFLPVLGLWMLPAGLLLVAVDVPPLRAPVASASVRLRRRVSLLRRRWRRRPA